jgi:hypothetical protein
MRSSAGVLAAVAAAALVAAGVVAAGDGKQKIEFNAADQAAARSSVLRRNDLGSSGWQGGPIKPDLTPAMSCPNFHPKISDLVVTGAAETAFRRDGVELSSVAEILRTRRMVQLDWRRSVLPRAAVSCLRRTLAKGLPAGAKIVSFARTSFPHIGRGGTRFHGVIRIDVLGRTARLVTDIVFVYRSRTEITLSATGPASAASSLSAAERRLARALVSRVRA